MSLLLLFNNQVATSPAPFSTEAEGQHTFLHHPTTSNVGMNTETLYDVFMGDVDEMAYYVEEMRRRHLAIVVNQGQDFYLLPRKLQGVRCPFWRSEEEQCEKPLDSIAPCYNTGWVGGYHNPMLIKIVLPPNNKVEVRYEEGVRKESKPRPWTIHTPTIRNRDLLVDKFTGDRWEVMDKNDVRFRGLMMHQDFTIRQLTREKESYYYAIQLPRQ